MIKIDVTQEDIINGWQAEAKKCPVALALKRHIPEGWYLTGVTHHVVALRQGDGDSTGVSLPPNVHEWIVNFDRPHNDRIKTGSLPFSFEITLPWEAQNVA